MHTCDPARHWSRLLPSQPLRGFYQTLWKGRKTVEVEGTAYHVVENIQYLAREYVSYADLKNALANQATPFLLQISLHRRETGYGGTFLIFECVDELEQLRSTANFQHLKDLILAEIVRLEQVEFAQAGEKLIVPFMPSHRLAAEKPPRARQEIIEEPRIIGTSRQAEELRHFVRQAALHDAQVLILGETGVGKDLVASAIHWASQRRSKAFVKVNCTALPSELIESELFGHKKGSFTGAIRDHHGAFQRANGGTLFLNEIGDMPLELQAKLLHAVEDQKFDIVGGERVVSVDVRLITATNVDLRGSMASGRFREDLFYRISVLTCRISPLRECSEDIPALVSHFLQEETIGKGKGGIAITEEAIGLLQKYRWPGNIRQLENVIKRAVLLCEGRVLDESDFADIEETSATPVAPSAGKTVITTLSLRETARRAVADVEKAMIARTLDATHWNRTRTARLLKISYRSLLYKIKDYKLKSDSGEEVAAILPSSSPPIAVAPKRSSAVVGVAGDRQIVLDTLIHNNWHKKKTAAALGISTSTLFLRIDKFDFAKEEKVWFEEKIQTMSVRDLAWLCGTYPAHLKRRFPQLGFRVPGE